VFSYWEVHIFLSLKHFKKHLSRTNFQMKNGIKRMG
jgi:hypothetical protein